MKKKKAGPPLKPCSDCLSDKITYDKGLCRDCFEKQQSRESRLFDNPKIISHERKR